MTSRYTQTGDNSPCNASNHSPVDMQTVYSDLYQPFTSRQIKNVNMLSYPLLKQIEAVLSCQQVLTKVSLVDASVLDYGRSLVQFSTWVSSSRTVHP